MQDRETAFEARRQLAWPWSLESLEHEAGGAAGITTVLPRAGVGYYSYHPRSPERQFGTAATIRALEAIASAWAAAHPAGPRIGVGDISRKGGGKMAPHVSHDRGVDVDLRLVRSDGKELPVTFRDRAYSRALTQALVDAIRANPIAPVKVIYFNDPSVTGVRPWPGHDNHLHVRFMAAATNATPPSPPPAKPPLTATEQALVRARIAAGTRSENALTDAVFFARHPERRGRALQASEKTLVAEWLQIRARVVRPLLALPTPRPGASVPPARDPDVRAALARWNLATGVVATPLFHQLVERWRPPHLPLSLLVAFSSLEASGFGDATHGTERNNWTKPAFYELGVFQVPAGLHGTCTSGAHRDCAHAPPGHDPERKSPWFKLCGQLGLDPKAWTNPTTQVRVGVANLEADAATVRRLFPQLFPDRGSAWALRASVLLPFGPGIGYTIKLLRKHVTALARLPEAQRWAFLRTQGAETANVDKKMSRALKLARALGSATTGLEG
jgi:hypothetical protein